MLVLGLVRQLHELGYAGVHHFHKWSWIDSNPQDYQGQRHESSCFAHRKVTKKGGGMGCYDLGEMNNLGKDFAPPMYKTTVLNKKGEIVVDKHMRTNIEFFYAAGDVCDASDLKQIITAAAQGAIASDSAYTDISKKQDFSYLFYT